MPLTLTPHQAKYLVHEIEAGDEAYELRSADWPSNAGNLALDAWLSEQGNMSTNRGFGMIYVNDRNKLDDPKTPFDMWNVQVIEERPHRLVFEAGSL